MSNLPLIAIFSYVVILCLSVFSCVNMATVQAPPAVSTPAVFLTAEEKQARRVAKMAALWPKAPDYRMRFNALSPEMINTDGAKVYASFDPNDDYWGLPHTDGYEDIAIYCSACHTLEIVMQQRASRERWDYMLEWMTKEQNMPPLPKDQKTKVLNYLSENFGPALL